MFITQVKLDDIQEELHKWIHKDTMTRNQLESIVGKLQAVSHCVRSAHIFISRMLNKLPLINRNWFYHVDENTRLDIKWWRKFLPQYNRTSIMWLEQMLTHDQVLATDTCLTSIGGNSSKQYFHEKIPLFILDIPDIQIAHLESIAVMIAL